MDGGLTVSSIPGQYGSPLADVTALAVLGAFFVFLVAHCGYEARRAATSSSMDEDGAGRP